MLPRRLVKSKRRGSREGGWKGGSIRTKTISHRQRGAIFLVPRGMQIRRSRLTRGRNLLRFAHTHFPILLPHFSYYSQFLYYSVFSHSLSLFLVISRLCLGKTSVFNRAQVVETVIALWINIYYARREPARKARCMQITSVEKAKEGEKFISLHLRASQCVMKLLTVPIHRSLRRGLTSGQRLHSFPHPLSSPLLSSSRV